MLEADPVLPAHVSQASLSWSASDDADSSLADQVSSLSGLTKLELGNRDSPLGAAGMLDALRQLSALQSLHCLASAMRMLLVNAVPSSWSLLTILQLTDYVDQPESLNWYLVEQRCPQLQALAMHETIPLCLTALTSLTCNYWEPQDTDSFQCSQLAHLHVKLRANLNLLPSTLTGLSLTSFPRLPPVMADLQHQHLRSQQSLVHICFTSQLEDLSDILGLVPAMHPMLANSVTSVELTIHPRAFLSPDVTNSMAGQHFHHLCAWFPHMQRLHMPAHCRNE